MKAVAIKCNSCDAPLKLPAQNLSVIKSAGIAVFIGRAPQYIVCEFCDAANHLDPGSQHQLHTGVTQIATVIGDGNTVVQSVSNSSNVSQSAVVYGSGAIAQGPGSVAVAAGAVNLPPDANVTGNIFTGDVVINDSDSEEEVLTTAEIKEVLMNTLKGIF